VCGRKTSNSRGLIRPETGCTLGRGSDTNGWKEEKKDESNQSTESRKVTGVMMNWHANGTIRATTPTWR
jgi:hypothetical protein